MRPRLALPFLLTCFIAGQTVSPAAVPITNEPAHHLTLENEYVRVFKVEVAPRTATLMHRHENDYVFVTLGDSQVSNEREGEKPVTLKLKDGETRFTKGGFAHVARNLSQQPFRNVTVEILIPSGTYICGVGQGVCGGGAGGMSNGGGWNWNSIAESDKFLVRRVAIGPGTTVPPHEHKGPHLVVAITDLHIRNDVEGKQPADIEAKKGDINWVPGGFKHSVTNVGKEPARFVTIEFK